MFSIVISTYNGSKYILNTIENIRQSLKNFDYEMIIVNDGSIDDTSKRLEIYKENKRIKIFNQRNKGISASRNRGIRHISKQSNYVVFIDDSDKVEENFFEKINEFFTIFHDIDVVATPLIRTVNGANRHHSLNYRFHSGKQIVNILDDYKYIQFHIGGMAFRSDLLKNPNYRFDEGISFWEDAKFINSILLDKKTYGLIPETAYFYNSDNPHSLSKIAWNLEERYLPLIEKNYMYLIDKSHEIYGKTIKYIQFLVGTHYSEYLKEHNQDKIIDSPYFDSDKFGLASQKLFTNIDTDIIYDLKIHHVYIDYLLRLKGKELETSKFSEQFSVYIHRFNPLKRDITFSFSNETSKIPLDSNVYLNYYNNKLKQATLIEQKQLSILGEPINDFSKNFYKIKLPLISLFIRSKIIIIKNDTKYKIDNPSILSRIIKNVKKQSIYRRKQIG
ncbi:glycosyltransferase family 2 protein [Staphylococcus rostri]|nr:glycosyltransferase family 2 protein [Staphylococcus rostri]